MTTLTARSAGGAADALAAGSADWRAAAIAMLSVRVIQGFIYWGGGSRRFIYAPSKLDPAQPSWMANKLQAAMPGALFGSDQIVAFLLHHFWLLYGAIVIFSAAELIVGLALMAGLMTRLAALLSVGISIALMLLFGWQGGTCIDEWTMAACNVAMGASLMLAGSAAYSLDNAWLRRNPGLAERMWFRWGGGSLKLPLSDEGFRKLALAVLALVLVFDVGFYNYYRGSVLTPYHKGPVGPAAHHFTLSDATLLSDGGVRFAVYLDGGTPAVPAHIMQVEVVGPDGKALATWDWRALSALAPTAIANDFAYNRFEAAPYGLEAGVGARAIVTLPPPANADATRGGAEVRITDVNGKRFASNLPPA
jgi:thiosulfate dehydrogenase [quinone] large subunit